MMECGGVKVYSHTFLTSTLDGDERVSCPQELYGRRKARGFWCIRISAELILTLWRQILLDSVNALEKKNTSVPCRRSKQGPSIDQPLDLQKDKNNPCADLDRP